MMIKSLIFEKPIPIDKENEIYIYHPIVDEIDEISEEVFSQYVAPFILTVEGLFINSSNYVEMVNNHHIFDIFFMQTESGYALDGYFNDNTLDFLVRTLSFFLKEEDIEILYSRKKLVVNKEDGKKFLIDDRAFDKIREAVQAITLRKDMKAEKAYKSKQLQEIDKIIRDGERRKAEREAVRLDGVVNTVALGGASYIPYEEIQKWSYYRLMTAYSGVTSIAAYNHLMGFKLSEKYEVKDKVSHWSETLKLRKVSDDDFYGSENEADE